MSEHIDSCHINEVIPCTYNDGVHQWTGWPQSFCVDCHASDMYESCIRNICKCKCHIEFWEGYELLMQKKGNRW